MATLGSQANFQDRLKKLLPRSWFPNPAPILYGALAGAANMFSTAYGQLKFAKAQTRMATTSDAFLEIAAIDYVGLRIQRRAGETDMSFRARIVEEALRVRNTRKALIIALTQLTGRPPQIYAPWSTGDLGALDVGTLACDVAGAVGTGFYPTADIPFTIFVNAFRPLPNTGFGATDAEIYAMVNNVAAAGITAWVNIQN